MKLVIAAIVVAFLIGLFLHTPAQACALDVQCSQVHPGG